MGGERHRDPAEFSGRDPRPGGHALRRVELPAPVRQPACLHARRPARLPRGDEPGGAQGAPGRPQDGRAPHRQHPGLRQAQPRQGRLCGEPARRPDPRGALPAAQGGHDGAHARGHQGSRAQREGEGPDEELLRARPGLVDLHAPARAHARVDPEEVRQDAVHRRGEHARAEGGPRLRRDRRDLRRALRGRAGGDGAGPLPGDDGQSRACVGPPRGGAAVQGPPRLRRVSDHASE